VTRREQFHDFRIGEMITAYSPAIRARVDAVQQSFISKGFDPVGALNQAYAVIKSVVRRDAYVMSFNDAFLIIAIGLLVSAAAIWACKVPNRGSAATAAH
jgi:DHA2 family multidrug resistance protein